MSQSSLQRIHENYLAALQRITVLGSGGESTRLGPWTLVHAGSDFDYFNIAAISGPVTEPVAAMDEAARWFRKRDGAFRLILRDPTDASVAEAATRAGFIAGEREPAMYLARHLARPPVAGSLPEGFALQRVETHADALAYAEAEPGPPEYAEARIEVTRRALALDGCALFLGLAGGEVVGRSLSLTTARTTGVYNVYVRPANRGRGFGRALTDAAIDAGREHGADAACLVATELGYPLYRAMGFRERFHYVSLWRP